MTNSLILSPVEQILGQNGHFGSQGVQFVLHSIFAADYDVQANLLLTLVFRLDLPTFLNFSID